VCRGKWGEIFPIAGEWTREQLALLLHNAKERE
jgi:hypothetical protein